MSDELHAGGGIYGTTSYEYGQRCIDIHINMAVVVSANEQTQ